MAADMTTKQRTRLVVCADDYALTPGVSRAIRELIEDGRISATSVMTVCPFWPEEAPALKAVCGNADIGLHLTLTDHVPLGDMRELAPEGRFPTIDRMLRESLRGRLPLLEIEMEIERQLDRFVEVWQRLPAHVDGHHHVHQLPGVRSALLRVLGRQRFGKPYLRSCREPAFRILSRGVAPAKATLLSGLALGLSSTAKDWGLATNQGFSGVYDFASGKPIEALFAAFVRNLGPRPLAMCHPGYSDEILAGLDSLTRQREVERHFLAGPDWPRVLDAAGVVVAPFAPNGRYND